MLEKIAIYFCKILKIDPFIPIISLIFMIFDSFLSKIDKQRKNIQSSQHRLDDLFSKNHQIVIETNAVTQQTYQRKIVSNLSQCCFRSK